MLFERMLMVSAADEDKKNSGEAENSVIPEKSARFFPESRNEGEETAKKGLFYGWHSSCRYKMKTVT